MSRTVAVLLALVVVRQTEVLCQRVKLLNVGKGRGCVELLIAAHFRRGRLGVQLSCGLGLLRFAVGRHRGEQKDSITNSRTSEPFSSLAPRRGAIFVVSFFRRLILGLLLARLSSLTQANSSV